MRIRKRLALCSIPTPPPLSDLQLRRSEAATPSDQNERWAFPKREAKMKQKEFGDDDYVNTNNDIRKIVSICHGEEDSNTIMQPSSSALQGRCCGEGYKLVPLKKRKGIFERNPNEESSNPKMKSKTNKKYGECDRKAGVEENVGGGARKSKSKRGSVILGCSRVNGRGWRCCQATLVGYSLCEHHLGKGRLRSITWGNLTNKRTKARSITTLLTQISSSAFT
ncbi:uncharacterized protein LOC131000564 [Salvia miltiorrhiza]|uniref:uncharacterized protein LOC131000564 n=1 Tax=Salvia miltiorrhiza TaxID=226208 RepID=UPI0025AD325F|nr:uncharacterized protein LOC131000564 [Salvia miltiorrhiza]